MNEQSIVHWFAERDAHKCGYCKSPSGSIQFGMWAQTLTVDDYQYLIDRGWRRSGQYCYKPVMDETCCPLYTIRCDTSKFHATKSQKKVMKSMSKFLKTGELKRKNERNSSDKTNEENVSDMDNYKECPNVKVDTMRFMEDTPTTKNQEYEQKSESKIFTPSTGECVAKVNSKNEKVWTNKIVNKGLGPDPNKPPCKKAKVIRLERKREKNQKLEVKSKNQEKTLEEFLNFTSSSDRHKLKTVLIEPTNPECDWDKFKQLEFELFQKYQEIIHDDPPHKNSMEGFMRFLVNTPLQSRPVKNSTISYGSHHQQYWLDDKLIAVGVIDILPKCISAVYFFYDPDYRELTLGTYSALREVQLSRELTPSLNTKYYYMGYYIHTCPKMKYKGNIHPSYLLCPETYQWIPIEGAIKKLDISKYSRLSDDLDALDEDECTLKDLDKMKIVIDNKFMRYGNFKRYLKKNEDNYKIIGKLVGRKCLESMFFVES